MSANSSSARDYSHLKELPKVLRSEVANPRSGKSPPPRPGRKRQVAFQLLTVLLYSNYHWIKYLGDDRWELNFHHARKFLGCCMDTLIEGIDWLYNEGYIHDLQRNFGRGQYRLPAPANVNRDANIDEELRRRYQLLVGVLSGTVQVPESKEP